MFDDVAHIQKNVEITISDLSWNSLDKAWNSSPFNFPHNRPIAQLSFALNHLLTGLDPYWFVFCCEINP